MEFEGVDDSLDDDEFLKKNELMSLYRKEKKRQKKVKRDLERLKNKNLELRYGKNACRNPKKINEWRERKKKTDRIDDFGKNIGHPKTQNNRLHSIMKTMELCEKDHQASFICFAAFRNQKEWSKFKFSFGEEGNDFFYSRIGSIFQDAFDDFFNDKQSKFGF